MLTGAKFDFRIIDTNVNFVEHELSPPLVIGKGTIKSITEASCCVTVTDGTRTAHGFGTVLLSHVWCWPEESNVDKALALRDATKSIADALKNENCIDNVLGHGFHLLSIADQLLPHLPALARRVCCAPLDNAIHDAAGCLNDCSSFALFTEHPKSPFDTFFPGFGAAAAIDSVLRPPLQTIDAQMVVGIGTTPDTVAEYCSRFGVRRLKVKVGSGDIESDYEHVVQVTRAVPIDAGAPEITLDANGSYGSPSVLANFIALLTKQAPDVRATINAIEQPSMSPNVGDRNAWSDMAFDLPILVDETFTQMDDLKFAATCGWNGLAVKSCRGQTLALLGAAWAHARGWTLTVMDLTSPNIAALHTVLLAAHISGVETAEVNSAQYLKTGYANLPTGLQESVVPREGKLQVPTVTQGLVPDIHRMTLMRQFEVA